MADEISEVLLGEDLLKTLGIDVHQQLIEKGGCDVDYNEMVKMASIPPLGGMGAVQEIGNGRSRTHLGGDNEEKIKAILEEKFLEMDDPDFGPEDGKRWRNLLYEHVNEFRMIIADDRPLKIEAYNAQWDKKKAEKVKPRRMGYNQDQKQHLEYFCGELLDRGYIYENNRARYASEVIVVPKCKNPSNIKEDYRMVINLKAANAAIDPILWPFPTMEDVQQYLTGAKYFISMDIKNGFWQVKLHRDCQELFSFTTHRATFTPNRLPQGAVDSSAFFTWAMHIIFHERISKGILPWIDDLFLYAKTIGELYELLKWVARTFPRGTA